MSFLGKKWIVRNTDENKSALQKILHNRGVNDINEGLVFHDPFLFEDMEKAVTRVKKAVENGEKIIVFGDYDVDGISGSAILITVLKKLGANISYKLPNRMTDGYGMSEKFIGEFIEQNIKVIITVDCGISCVKEIAKANNGGIDVIITDHHTVPENLPNAHAILHPQVSKYPFKELTGSAVAFKFAQALLCDNEQNSEQLLNELMTLASLGVVADLGKLTGENRLIVKRGLENLQITKNHGLKKIIELAGIQDKTLDTQSISFRIAPRINAAGRIGDPYVALGLLLQEEWSESVASLGDKLESLNVERQDMLAKALLEADEFFKNKEILPYILIAENTDWHVGILGLVASRLAETYNRPSIIMQDFGDTLVASARSSKMFNITEALSACGKYLIAFGGHAQAAGFNLKKENLELFKEAIGEYAKSKLENEDFKAVLEIDCELNKDDVSFGLLDELKVLEPFGVGNEKPTFLLQNLEPYFINCVGKENAHLKFTTRINNRDIQAIGFGMGHLADTIRKHKALNLVCNVDKNTWNNRDYVQLKILDIDKARD